MSRPDKDTTQMTPLKAMQKAADFFDWADNIYVDSTNPVLRDEHQRLFKDRHDYYTTMGDRWLKVTQGLLEMNWRVETVAAGSLDGLRPHQLPVGTVILDDTNGGHSYCKMQDGVWMPIDYHCIDCAVVVLDSDDYHCTNLAVCDEHSEAFFTEFRILSAPYVSLA